MICYTSPNKLFVGLKVTKSYDHKQWKSRYLAMLQSYSHEGSSSSLEMGLPWRANFLCTGCGSLYWICMGCGSSVTSLCLWTGCGASFCIWSVGMDPGTRLLRKQQFHTNIFPFAICTRYCPWGPMMNATSVPWSCCCSYVCFHSNVRYVVGCEIVSCCSCFLWLLSA